MRAIAQAPLPFIAALTILGLALLGIMAKAVFAPTDDPARRLYAILSAIRRQHPSRWPSQASAPARLPVINGTDRSGPPQAAVITLTIQPTRESAEISGSSIPVTRHDHPANVRVSAPVTSPQPDPPQATAASGSEG
jgi:hypothetical protein